MAKKEDKHSDKTGRKPRFDYDDPVFLAEVEGYARDGWDDKQIAENYGLNSNYFTQLKAKFPNLNNAIKRGKAPLDLKVENSLYKRATGLRVKTVVKRWQIVDGIESPVEIIQETETELPPDTGAAMAWLKQRKPEQWNKQPDKHEVSVKGSISPDKWLQDMIEDE